MPPTRDSYARPIPVTVTRVVSASPVTLFGFNINTEAAAQTASIYNDPAAANNLIAVVKLDSRQSFAMGTDGAYFDKGIYVVISGGSPDVTFVVG